MAIRTRLEPLGRDITLVFGDELSAAARSRRLSDFAKDELAIAQARNKRALGYTPPHQTYVDSRKGAAVENVRPDGIIIYEFELLETVLGEIAELLIKHSPVRTGRFQSSHVLFADGVEVVPGQIPPDAEEYAFASTQPYARKIERGLSDQAPEGVFEVVAVLSQRRFGNIARVRYGFRSVPEGAIGGWARTGSARALAKRVRGGNPSGHHDWLTRQPAVVIIPRR